MNACKACVFFSLWVCVANAKAAADNPTFMMVSGISASEEMCLTAANGTCTGQVGFGRLCLERVCAQGVWTLMEQT